MQPNAEENRRRKIVAQKSLSDDCCKEPETSSTKIKFPRKPKDNLPEILGSFAKSLLSSTDNTDSFDKNSKILQVIRDSPYASDGLRALGNSDATFALADSMDDMSMETALTSTKRTLFHAEDNSSPTTLPSSAETCDTENASVDTVIQTNAGARRGSRRNSMLATSKTTSISNITSPTTKRNANKRHTLFAATSKITDYFNDSKSDKSDDLLDNCDSKIRNTSNGMDIDKNKSSLSPNSNKTKIGVSTRRRTLYTPNSMEVSQSDEPTPQKRQRRQTMIVPKKMVVNTPKKTPRKRFTMCISESIDETPPPVANDHSLKISENDLMTPPINNKILQAPNLLSSVLRRHTIYTPQAMHETIVETQSPTTPELLASQPSSQQQLNIIQEEQQPTQLPKPSIRRRTLFTPNKLIEVNRGNKMECRDQLFDTASCDAIMKTASVHKCK